MAQSILPRTLPASRAAGWLLVGAAAVATAALFGPRMLRIATGATPHGLDASLFLAQPTVVQVHVLAAISAVAMGAIILWARKGRTFHRVMGWSWAGLMGVTAGSSLFIVGLNGNAWSLIHLLSGWVLVSMPFAVWAAHRHNVNLHRRAMTSLFWGASIVAGGFAFLPGRLMWRLFMG